jgi:hypothetical protein
MVIGDTIAHIFAKCRQPNTTYISIHKHVCIIIKTNMYIFLVLKNVWDLQTFRFSRQVRQGARKVPRDRPLRVQRQGGRRGLQPLGPILQSSISAEKFSEFFSPSVMDKI